MPEQPTSLLMESVNNRASSPALLKRSSETAPTSSVEKSAFPKMREAFRDDVSEMVRGTSGQIIITSHMMPDDDAACSALAQKRILQSLYPDKKFKVVFSERKIDAWDDLLLDPSEIVWAKSELGKTAEDKVRQEDIIDYIKGGDALIGLDQGKFSSFTRFESQLSEMGTKTAILDHHQDPPSSATTSYVEPEATSTCEVIAKMYGPENLSADVAELLLIGILSDTQGFKIPADYSETKPIAERLQARCGKTHEEMKARIRKSEQEKIYKESFKKHIKKYNAPNSPSQTYSYITFKDMIPSVDTTNHNYDLLMARRDFMNELVETGDSDIYWTTRPGNKKGNSPATEYGVMFRRSPTSTIDLNALANQYGGGGHKGAASGKFELTPDMLEDIEQRKKANPKFSEIEYICDIIKNDIANRLKSQVPEPEKVVVEKPQELPTPVASSPAQPVTISSSPLTSSFPSEEAKLEQAAKAATYKATKNDSSLGLLMRKVRSSIYHLLRKMIRTPLR